MFRKTKSRYEELEVFFQIISLIRYLRRSLSLKERQLYNNKEDFVGKAFLRTRVRNLEIKTLVQKIIFIVKYFIVNHLVTFSNQYQNTTTHMLREVLLTIKFLSSMQKLFFSKNYFFPAVITEWNNVDISIRNSSSCHIFKNLTLKFIRPEPYIISSTQNFEGLKLLKRMRLGLSRLADHKVRHNFQDCLNTICGCGQETETLSHSLLHCLDYFLKKLTSLVLIFYSKTTYL